jgi:hypothetical protein
VNFCRIALGLSGVGSHFDKAFISSQLQSLPARKIFLFEFKL